MTILPAGQALGVTEQLPVDERHLYSESYLHDSLAVRLGGRAAELVVFGEGSTGASNDLAGAPTWPRGWSGSSACADALGPVGLPVGRPDVPRRGDQVQQRGRTPRRPSGSSTRRSPGCSARPRSGRRSCWSTTVTSSSASPDLLLEQETVDGEAVYEIVGRPVPGGHPQVLSSE